MRSESFSYITPKKILLPKRSATDQSVRKVCKVLKRALKSRRTSSTTYIEDELECFEPNRSLTKSQSKKQKYFSEKQDKSIFKKLLSTTYHERNAQFKKLFVEKKLVEEDDIFLADFSCAYQREILCQGRMFVSQRSICFHSNIFGWETLLVIPIVEIDNISKQRAAKIFPNSIQFTNKKGEKFFFASYVNRDRTIAALEQLVERHESGEHMTPDEMYELVNEKSPTGSITPSNGKLLAITQAQGMEHGTPDNVSEAVTEATTELGSFEDEEEATCECPEHQGRLLMDAVFEVPTHSIKELLFNDSPWFNKFNEELKNSGYTSSLWARDKSGVNSRTCTYTIALNHAMAPKSCTANERQVLSHLQRRKDGFTVEKETQNAGVPYSDNFSVIVKYCVTRVAEHQSRVIVHGYVNYKKGTWNIIKGYIEKSAYQGMEDHYSTLEKMLKDESLKIAARRKKKTDSEKSETISIGSFVVEDPVMKAPVEIEEPRTRLTAGVETTSKVVAPSPAIRSFENYAIIGLLAALLIFNMIILWNVSAGINLLAEQRQDKTIELLTGQMAELQKKMAALSPKQEL